MRSLSSSLGGSFLPPVGMPMKYSSSPPCSVIETYSSPASSAAEKSYVTIVPSVRPSNASARSGNHSCAIFVASASSTVLSGSPKGSACSLLSENGPS